MANRLFVYPSRLATGTVRRWRLPRWLPLTAGLVVLGMALILWSRLQHQESALLERRIELDEINLRDSILSSVELRVRSLIRMARRWESGLVERGSWEIDAALLASDEACQAVGWVDSSMRLRGVVPLKGNEALWDRDLTAEAGPRAALEASRDGRLATLADTTQLLNGQPGFLFVAPFSFEGRFDGAIVGVFAADALLGSILGKAEPLDYVIRIREGDAVIFEQNSALEVDESWARSAAVDLRGLSWQLVMVPSATLVRSSFWLSTLALVTGILTAALIAAAGQLARTAQLRAGEAEDALAALKTEVVERRRAEEALQRTRDELEVRVGERTASLREANLELEREVERRQSAHRALQLAVRELDHRVKNTLAMVQAVAEQTLAVSESLPEFSAAFQGRIAALARIHRALGNEGLSLSKLIDLTVAPYVPRAGGLVVRAEPLALSPHEVRAIGMALHELATNAAKYGALSVPCGRVEVVARTSGANAHRRLHLEWRESGGPPVSPPARRGVGTTLIEDALAYELAGNALAEYDRCGVCWEIEVSLGSAERQPHAS